MYHSRGWGSSRNPGTLLLSNKGTKRKFLVQKLLKCPSKRGFIFLLSHKSKLSPFWVSHFLQHEDPDFAKTFIFSIPRGREFPLASRSNMSWAQPFSTVFHPLEGIQYPPDPEVFHWFYWVLDKGLKMFSLVFSLAEVRTTLLWFYKSQLEKGWITRHPQTQGSQEKSQLIGFYAKLSHTTFLLFSGKGCL